MRLRTGLFALLKACAAACAVFAAANAAVAQAQDAKGPRGVVTIISPFAPGSAPDVSARVLAPLLAERWAAPVVVENKVGANGNIAMASAARAVPDGTTLIMAPDTVFCINPHLYKSTSFDPSRDFVPVASVVSNQFLLLVHPSVKASDLAGFVALARSAKPPLLYASIGVGSLHQLTMEMLKKRAGIELTHVPHRGGNATLTAILGGEVQAAFSGAASAGIIASGKLKALAISGSKRSAAFPDIPTLGETYPGLAVDAWMGLFAPAGMPESLLDKIRADVRDTLASPAFTERINVSGNLEPLLLDVAAFKQTIASDTAKYAAVLKELNIQEP
jgi:tripartite-type tricarboxylate transporter receptor subunit TctC